MSAAAVALVAEEEQLGVSQTFASALTVTVIALLVFVVVIKSLLLDSQPSLVLRNLQIEMNDQ